MIIQLVLFAVLSIALLIFTLKRPYRHRYPRFVLWECFLGLILLNAPQWFINPFSTRQLISWSFLICSLGLIWHGLHLLATTGSPEGDIENTTQMVTKGAYRYIRHPIYASILYGGLGAYLKDPTQLATFLFVILVVFGFLTAKVEEKETLKRFGEQYAKYMNGTKMFVPYLI